ncbi:hypothetical protein JHK87_035235 [Glycine soja]|nr:hypothetical protein JHK87_035235 [Glycine soja]
MDRLHNQVFMPERVTHLQIYLEKVIVGVPRKMVMNKPKVFDLEKFKQLGLQFTMLVKSYNTSSHELCLVFDLERPNVLNVPMVLRCVFPLVDVSQGFKLHDGLGLRKRSFSKICLQYNIGFSASSSLQQHYSIENIACPEISQGI